MEYKTNFENIKNNSETRDQIIKIIFPELYKRIEKIKNDPQDYAKFLTLLNEIMKEKLTYENRKDLIQKSLIYFFVVGSTPPDKTLENYNPHNEPEIIFEIIDKSLQLLEDKQSN